jgi:predicted Zn-dependent peptidase
MKSLIKTATLKNGLTLVGEPNSHAKSLSLGFFVKTGGRDEVEGESGLSHFLEHMMFKGTAKRSAEQVNFDLGNIGAQANAYTSEENTVYYASVLPEYFENLHEVLSDMLRPALDPKEFFMEQKVILEEIALYRDRPQFWFFQELLKDYYGQNPLGQPVLGTEASVSALTPEVMRSYFDRRYCPSNMVLSCAGDFNWDRFVELSEQNCGSWSKFNVARQYHDFKHVTLDRTYSRPKLNLAQYVMTVPGVSANSSDRFALGVLGVILGDHVGSRLYWALVDSGLADSASASNDENDGSGLFTIYASCLPENIKQVEQIIDQELAKLKDISEQELERAKTKLATRVVSSGELPLGRMMALGNGQTYRGKCDSLDNIMTQVLAVTREEILSWVGQTNFIEASRFRLMPE